MKRILIASFAAAASAGALMPATAVAGAEDGAGPYFCGKSFTLFVMKGEAVTRSSKQRGMHVLSSSGRDYVFSEGDFAVPAGAKPVREDDGVEAFRVSRGGKLIGYLIAVEGSPSKVMVKSRSFEGNARDLDVLSRFNFHPNRSGGCRTSTP